MLHVEELRKAKLSEDEIRARIQAVEENGIFTEQAEYISRKGKAFWGELTVRAFTYQEARYYLLVIDRIDLVKETERQLAQDRQRFDALLEHASMGIIETNNRADIISINRFALNLFGYNKEEVLNQKIELLIPARFHSKHINHRDYYRKKQIVYSEGNHPNRLYFVLKGKVKAFKTNEDGKELITELYSAGDFVGYIALLEKSAYKDSVEAIEDTELAVIPKEDFDELIDRNPEVARKFIQLLAKNVSEKENQLLRLAYNSLRKKVADTLLLIQAKYNAEKKEKFDIDISRENLATMAGTATESLIRTLSDFKNEKMIDINEGRINIINQQKLEKLFN